MVCAIVSDIHSNHEALAVVLGTIEKLPVDVLYCLGDLVGYNADPDACVEAVLPRVKAVVRGNHDKAVAGLLNLDWFNHTAREAVLWTRRSARAQTLEEVKKLPPGPLEMEEGVLLCHGTPYDEDSYLMDMGSIMESYRFLEESHPETRFCLHGHTHYPQVVVRREKRKRPEVLRRQEETSLEPGATYLINPGSVGQPRDGIALASFGILDTNRLVYRNLRVAYGVQETQRKVLQAGLPPELARRLAEGR
ncbi:MAG: metallophosphoesterase family protein [Spirochaetia bacterium]|jgi:predicted phosphodiesterase